MSSYQLFRTHSLKFYSSVLPQQFFFYPEYMCYVYFIWWILLAPHSYIIKFLPFRYLRSKLFTVSFFFLLIISLIHLIVQFSESILTPVLRLFAGCGCFMELLWTCYTWFMSLNWIFPFYLHRKYLFILRSLIYFYIESSTYIIELPASNHLIPRIIDSLLLLIFHWFVVYYFW